MYWKINSMPFLILRDQVKFEKITNLITLSSGNKTWCYIILLFRTLKYSATWWDSVMVQTLTRHWSQEFSTGLNWKSWIRYMYKQLEGSQYWYKVLYLDIWKSCFISSFYYNVNYRFIRMSKMKNVICVTLWSLKFWMSWKIRLIR